MNICKSITAFCPENIRISHFVLETNRDVMKRNIVLKENRMVLFIAGKGTCRIDGDVISVGSGTLVFAFGGECFSVCGTDGLEYMYIDFSGVRADELFKRFEINRINRTFSNFEGLTPLWKESLSRATPNTVDLASESMVLYTLSRLNTENVKKDSVIGTVLRITENRFREPYLSIGVVSDELGYNPKYLSHLFKKKTGIGFSEYLTNTRIKYAVSLFDYGISSVKNAALLSGFSDPLYFSSVFKKIVGITPREYIAAASETIPE